MPSKHVLLYLSSGRMWRCEGARSGTPPGAQLEADEQAARASTGRLLDVITKMTYSVSVQML
jgi:hypothetical protein